MFSMTKSMVLDELQTFYFVNKRHYGEDVKFYQCAIYIQVHSGEDVKIYHNF